MRDIQRKAKNLDVPIKKVAKKKLDEISERGSHQGVMAEAAPFDYVNVTTILDAAKQSAEEHDGRALIVVPVSYTHLALWIAGLVLLGIVEHMKRKYDLVTYRDILAYSRGEEPPRDGAAFARRHPVMMGWVKGIVSAIAGFVVAVVLCRIFLG